MAQEEEGEFDWNAFEGVTFEVNNHFEGVTPDAPNGRLLQRRNNPFTQRMWNQFRPIQLGELRQEVVFIAKPPILAWFQKNLPYGELPKNVREELLTWALCYKHSDTLDDFIPREIFSMVCEYVKTDMCTRIHPTLVTLGCECDIAHCYVCTRTENATTAEYPRGYHSACERCRERTTGLRVAHVKEINV